MTVLPQSFPCLTLHTLCVRVVRIIPHRLSDHQESHLTARPERLLARPFPLLANVPMKVRFLKSEACLYAPFEATPGQ